MSVTQLLMEGHEFCQSRGIISLNRTEMDGAAQSTRVRCSAGSDKVVSILGGRPHSDKVTSQDLATAVIFNERCG